MRIVLQESAFLATFNNIRLRLIAAFHWSTIGQGELAMYCDDGGV
jgi:hypothetical protein